MSMYSNKFVMCVTTNGAPRKELPNGVVELPYGTEYALRFRNKHDRRALVKIFIDDEEVSSGGFVIPAHGVINVERFADVAKKFKFVPLDSEEAIDYGKNGRQDGTKGLIEARFYLEAELAKEVVYIPINPYKPVYVPWRHRRPYGWPYDYPGNDPFWYLDDKTPIDNFRYTSNTLPNGSGIRTSSVLGSTTQSLYDSAINQQNLNAVYDVNSLGLDGVTVEGGNSNQQFRSTYFNYSHEEPTIVKIFLRAYSEEKVREKALIEEEIQRLQKRLNSLEITM